MYVIERDRKLWIKNPVTQEPWRFETEREAVKFARDSSNDKHEFRKCRVRREK